MKHCVLIVLILALVTIPVSAQQTGTVTGTITASGSTCTAAACIPYTLPANAATLAIQVVGSFSGALQFEATIDGINVVTVSGQPIGATVSSTAATGATAAGVWQVNVSGLTVVQVRASSLMSGTPAITMQSSTGAAPKF